MPVDNKERVAILLCTFNGEAHLSRQLDSILAQEHRKWVIYASDDGSTDRTLSILQDYREKIGGERLVLLQGPRAGYAENFMSMLRNPLVVGDYYAFSDQDDCWDACKLARALAWMRQQFGNTAALYCGRTRLIDDDERPIGYSPLFARRPAFRNALTQSLAGGNTMLLNGAAHALLARTPAGMRVTSHDWWAYLLVTACGGRVHYDAYPTIGYRQHGANLIGSNAGLWARLGRLKYMLEGNYREWNDINLAGLREFEALMTQENLRLTVLFQLARRAGLLRRLWSLVRAGFYRQTFAGNVGMMLAVALRRF